MSTFICGVIPPDAAFKKAANAFYACKDAGVQPPEELYKILGLEYGTTDEPDPTGVVISTYDDEDLAAAVTSHCEEHYGGYNIDLDLLPKRYKIIRVKMN